MQCTRTHTARTWGTTKPSTSIRARSCATAAKIFDSVGEQGARQDACVAEKRKTDPTSNAKATICSPDPTMSLSRSGSWTHLLTPRKFWSPKAIGSSHGQPRARKAMHTPDPRSHNRRRTGLSLHSRHRGMPWPSMGPSTPVTGACQCSFVAPSR